MKKLIFLTLLVITNITQAQYSFEHTDVWIGNDGSAPKYFTEYNGELYFQARVDLQSELWKTNGTSNNATQVINLSDNLSGAPESLIVLNNELIFSAIDTGIGRELFKTDGTTTTLLKDIVTGPNDGIKADYNEEYEMFLEFNNELYFIPQIQNGNELWKTDGTPNGTVLVKDFTVFNGTDTFNNHTQYFVKGEKKILGVTLNNELFFTVIKRNASGSQIGTELWKTDGTTNGTVVVKQGLEYIYELTVFNNALYFSGDTISEGKELWKSDGTTVGTVLLEDIFPNNLNATFGKSSHPKNFIIFNNELFFQARGYDAGANEITGVELYKTNGTTVTLVKDIFPGNLNDGLVYPRFSIYNNELYFCAQTSNTSVFDLWKTDGTTNGTIRVLEPVTIGLNNDSFQFLNATVFNNELFFVNYQQLWKTDGTVAGTTQLSDDGTENTPLIISSFDFEIFNNRLWMQAYNNDESYELWSVFNSASASINETELTNLNVYPNPVKNHITISFSKNEFMEEVSVFNALGVQVIQAKTNHQKTLTINTSDLSKGVYFLNVKGDNQTYSKKIIK